MLSLLKSAPPLEFKAQSISDEDTEDYNFLLLETSGRYMDMGLNQEEADRLVFDDLGCIEFWQYVKQINGRLEDRREAA